MTNPFPQLAHPETSASTELSIGALGRLAKTLPELLALTDGASLDDRRTANAVMNQVPAEAMKLALRIGDDLPSALWDPAPVITFLSERERLAEAAEALHRLGVVETRLRRHLMVAGLPAAQAVLDLYAHLKRRSSRGNETLKQDETQRLAELLTSASRHTAKRAKQPDPTPAK